jgi:hypothetical protein
MNDDVLSLTTIRQELADWDRRFEGVGEKGPVFDGVSQESIDSMESTFGVYLEGGTYKGHAPLWAKPYLEYYFPSSAPLLNYSPNACGHPRCWCGGERLSELIEPPVFREAVLYPRKRLDYLQKRMALNKKVPDPWVHDWAWAIEECAALAHECKRLGI